MEDASSEGAATRKTGPIGRIIGQRGRISRPVALPCRVVAKAKEAGCAKGRGQRSRMAFAGRGALLSPRVGLSGNLAILSARDAGLAAKVLAGASPSTTEATVQGRDRTAARQAAGCTEKAEEASRTISYRGGPGRAGHM